ncbi:MAG: substrate-binding domain-containing protein [Gemmatimonadetes bacterium]|nr:sugar ABC transporter substrate-binding protein [Gemmatimonadota bacterium]NIQ55813.1 sugar ABC transporter substrate-binding protein [Gemmatimonadota bacterium]NIU76019.1 substrate-binding domain-containing protein [Gammaproteobacteria bacterium]NIX45591.1 substrate-binding domain-containing protein [Gemmatimonadota bacterium]NIY09880.1 substrate-binding domain-containing protein [Gemmatimonadota bacterium]
MRRGEGRGSPGVRRGAGRGGAAVAALLALAAGLAVTGCEPGGDPGAAAGDDVADRRFVVVTHGQSADPFWSVVSNGVRAAAGDLGVRAEYQAPTSFDMVEMSNLIDAAVASRPTGLVVSIPDPDALAASIRRAVEAGIPVVSINSGADAYRALGVLAHVGQTEYEAGRAGGERLAGAGARRVLCVNHEVGNLAQDQRCAGLRDALEAAGGASRVLAVDLADPADTQQRIAGALGADPALDGLLTLGPAAAGPALAALRETGRTDAVVYGTFDLTPEVIEAVRDGRMAFAIDQQQYLQGYLPIVLLNAYAETLAMPGGGQVIRTGPGFVTRETAGRVLELTRRGLR